MVVCPLSKPIGAKQHITDGIRSEGQRGLRTKRTLKNKPLVSNRLFYTTGIIFPTLRQIGREKEISHPRKQHSAGPPQPMQPEAEARSYTRPLLICSGPVMMRALPVTSSFTNHTHRPITMDDEIKAHQSKTWNLFLLKRKQHDIPQSINSFCHVLTWFCRLSTSFNEQISYVCVCSDSNYLQLAN